MLTLEHVYALVGIFLLIFAGFTAFDKGHAKKWGSVAFWAIYGVTFLFGTYIPPVISGILVIALAVIASLKLMGTGSYNEVSKEQKIKSADIMGNKIFIPAIAVPIITVIIAAYTKFGALIGFGIGALVGLALAQLLTREKVSQSFNEGRRLLDAIGWAAILSQFLAALGFLFDKAGVGEVVANMVAVLIPTGNVFATVVAYCVGMALFTMIMGNAFAAFAVITTGIGIPLVIVMHGANPAIAGSIAMLSGFCGTLLTPMAANFNVVPAALLEMDDKSGVIKAQVPIAVCMLCVNILLMYFLAF